MSKYTILQTDNVSEAFKNKPQWVTCVSVALGMCAIISSAVVIGIIIGYTYCYLEHHSGFRPVAEKITRSLNSPESEEVKNNRTINGAIVSSVLVSKILKLGHALVEVKLHDLPRFGEELQYT